MSTAHTLAYLVVEQFSTVFGDEQISMLKKLNGVIIPPIIYIRLKNWERLEVELQFQRDAENKLQANHRYFLFDVAWPTKAHTWNYSMQVSCTVS